MTTPEQTSERRVILTEAHHEFQKGLHSHAFFKINDRAISEDLVQGTFMKTWKFLVRGGKIDVMKAFLYHILNHLIVDQYRKHKTTSLDILVEKGFEPSAGDSDRFFNILDGKKALIFIQRLPLIYQKVMRMRYVQDLSLTEISLITGQSKNTIAVRIHRGLAKLKQLYNPV